MTRSLAGIMLVLALVVGLLLLAGCAEVPLDQGADVNRRLQFGSALHNAAYAGDLDTTRALLQRGADPNAKAIGEGWTPLHIAAWQGREGVVRLLLQAGSDPKAVDHEGRTPVSVAKKYGHTAIAALLEAASGNAGTSPPRPASQPPPPIY